jgi:histidine racemase
MKLKYSKTNLSGNTTAFIWNKITRKDQSRIATVIMKKDSLCVEQVGFIEKPEQKDVLARLQMMGGEICINATLSFVQLIAQKKRLKRFNLELSGYSNFIKCMVNKNQPTIMMKSLYKINTVSLKISQKKEPIKLVNLGGIAFFLVDRNLYGKGISYLKEFINVKNQTDKIALPQAWGIIFFNKNKIQPVVYVESTNSIVCENACGAGSLALSLAFNYKKIIQPTQETIEVIKNKENISISGNSKIIAEGFVYI